MSQHAFNVKVSNEQPSDRAVPDTRNPRCSEVGAGGIRKGMAAGALRGGHAHAGQMTLLTLP